MVKREIPSRLLILAGLLLAIAYVLVPAPAPAQVLESIVVAPANGSVPAGLSQQFTATGTYSDGSTQNLTTSVTWTSTNTAAATITSGGWATGLAVGSTTMEATSGSISGSTSLTVTASGLVGWWMFDDGSGLTAADSSGNGNTATLVNGVSWITGKIGDAVSANGVNQYVSIPAINFSATNAVTWAAWVNRTYSTAGGHTLFENSTNFSSSTTGFGLFPDDGQDCPTSAAMMTGVHGNVGYTLNCYAQPSSGVWHHIAVVYDKSQPGTSVISLYIDGVLQTPAEKLSTATNTNAFGDNPLFLFSRGGTTQYTAGEVDDLRLYNVALSATQIQQIYQAGTASLVSTAVTPANPPMSGSADLTVMAPESESAAATPAAGSSFPGITYDLWLDFEQCPTGSAPTATCLENSTHGATGTWDVSNTNGLVTVQSAAQAPDSALGDTGNRGMAVNVSTGSAGYIQFPLASSHSSLSLGVWYKTGVPGNYETNVVYFVSFYNAAYGQMERLSDEHSSFNNARQIRVSPYNGAVAVADNTWYWCTLKHVQGGVGSFSVYDTSLNLVGTTTFTDVSNAPIQTLQLGQIAGATQTSESVYLDDYIVDYTNANFPLLPAEKSLVSIAVTPANSSIAKGATQQFTATGTYSDNSTQNLTGSVTWSSSNTTVATITTAGLATGVATGSTTIEATSGSINGSTGLTVTAPVLVSIAVTPANPAIVTGTTQQFTATGTYSDNSTQNLTSSVTWSSSNTAVATITSGGLATGAATGSTTIQATSGSISGSASLTVTPVLLSITVTPANASIAQGATQQFTATGLYSGGGTLNLTSSVTWTSTNTAAATITSGGLATGAAAGSTMIQATSGAIIGSTGLTVTDPVLVSIAVTPANSFVVIGATQQFTATGTYSDSSTQNLTSLVTWTSSSTATATITSGGLATGVATGSTTIQASFGSISGSTGLTVTPDNLVGWWKFDDGSGTTAVDSSGGGNTATLVNGVSWVTGKIGDAVSANGVNQYVSTPAINLSATNAVTWAAWVNRTYSTAGGHTLFENSTNFNNSTTGFGLFPDDGQDCPTSAPMMTGVNGNVGYTLNCYAQPSSGVWHHIAVVYDKSQPGTSVISLYIDGVLQTPAEKLSTATNTNAFGDNPLFLFSRGGTTQYTAGEVDDLRLYNVALSATQIQQIYQAGTASLVSIAVTPANSSIAKGATQQFTATGTYSDNSTQNLTGSVTWSSSNTTVATITTAGLATGVATGSTTIEATSGSINDSTGLTVTAPVLVSIAVTPANPAIVTGTTQQFTATGTYSDNSTQNLTSSVTWSSSNTAVATITSGGLAMGAATGSTTIEATSGSVSGSTGLTVSTTLPSFTYLRPITLNNSGSTLTNYQVKIALNSSNMNFSHAKSDGSDVRVLASDGVTGLSYWIENWNSSTQVATVWALVPSIPNGTSTINLVYGNSSASTTASGTNTFLFFDDFSSGDASTLNGYYQESALAPVNLGTAQAWEGSDVPHFFTVIANPYGTTLDGTTYAYWAWYGLQNSTTSGIGLAGSNDLVNWHKYSANPVIPVATGASRPSVILVGTTLQMAYENTASPQQVGYATSTDGISWTIQSPFTSYAYGGYTPALWKNPNDGKFYLFWSSGQLSDRSYPIFVRSATTVAGLATASDTMIWTLQTASPSVGANVLYAPTNILYDSASGLYVLQFEAGPNLPVSNGSDPYSSYWDVTTLLSSSPTSGWYLAAGNPYHSGGNACPTSFNASGTLYTYYCTWTGSSWAIDYTRANVASGLQQYGKPKTSLWTDVHDTADLPPVWYLEPCTDWKGASSSCLVGFGRYSGVTLKEPMLESSYSGTNYILDGHVYGTEANDAQLGFRMSASSGDEYSADVYFNDNGATNFYITEKAPSVSNAVASVAAGNLSYNTWYQVEASTNSTTQAGSIENGTYSASGTDTTYASGKAGPSLELYGASMFSYLFIRQYAATPPTTSVGSETQNNPPGIYSPVNGSTLTSNAATFSWYAYPGATAYYLDLGASQGSNTYLDSGSLSSTTLSYSVTSLPVNGSTVWARWYYYINGGWQYTDYSYTAYGGIPSGDSVATITSPAPSSTLTGSSVTFSWSAGVGPSAYWLDVGNVAGGNQYYSSGSTTAQTATVNSLPTNGSTVYATLYSLIGSIWFSNAYTYTAFGPGAMQTPTPGSTLTGSSVTFTWSAAAGATGYWVDIGNVAGGNQYYQSGNLGNVLTTTVNGLPTNGSTVYVTLYSLVGGQWLSNAYTYTAFNLATGLGVMQTPTPGSSLTGSTVTFTWNAGSGATAYWVDIGNVAGGNQYYQSGNLGNVLTTTVNGLPTNGSTVYVTLYSLMGGQWLSNAYTYTAFNATAAGGVLTTPTPGSTLNSATVTFQWTAGAGASAYWLDVGSTAGGNQYYQSGNLGNVLTTTVTGLPTNGSPIYVTLYSLIGGQWSGNAYMYTALNAAGALATMQTPTPGSTLSGNAATFTWSADASATAYWLDIGNVPGGNQYYQSGNLGNVLTTTVYGLPVDGSTIYVTLYSLVGGQWLSNAYTYVSGP